MFFSYKRKGSEFLIILSCLLTLSCKQQYKELYKFDPEKYTDKVINLSVLADDIIYIPFDSIYPLGHLIKLEINKSSIYIGTSNLGILEYERNGKFTRRIGSVGRGPGEYISSNTFTIDKERGIVYNLDLDRKIKVYSKNGLFIRSIPLLETDGTREILFNNNMLIVMYSVQFGYAKYRWIAFDTLGNVIKKQDRKTQLFKGSITSRTTYKYDNQIYYWNHYLDTVFSITQYLTETPSFIISPGNHRLPKVQITIEQAKEDYLTKFLLIHKIFETDRFYVLYYHYKKLSLALIDKLTREVFLYDIKKDDLGIYNKAIVNDLDAGVSFFPEDYFTENGREYMIGIQYPSQLISLVSSEEFRGSIAKYPEKKKELEKLANSLKETDNPILVLVRLKR